jgi:hypothetical protein
MHKRKEIILKAAENNIHNKPLKNRVKIDKNFKYIPGEIVVLLIKNKKFYLEAESHSLSLPLQATQKIPEISNAPVFTDKITKTLVYPNIYYAFVQEKQKKNMNFENYTNLSNKNKYDNKVAVSLIPKNWVNTKIMIDSIPEKITTVNK